MYKSCSKCGKIHDINQKCPEYKRQYKYSYNESKLRNTNDWHKKADELRNDSKYLCAVCFDKGIYQYNNLEIHHIEKLKNRPDLLLDRNNLICLCKKCHKLADVGMIDKEYLYSLVNKREDEISKIH